MPKAFILMPFDKEFQPIYTGFLKPALESSGFDINRADDLDSHQNILKDIVEQINQSNLIVADLTTGNPNVFYELGLAHALGKSVILITQSIEDVPFDLRSYRLLEYSTHFAEIDAARETLTSYAKQFIEGNLKTGNPVTDFFPEVGVPKATTGPNPTAQPSSDPINGMANSTTSVVAVQDDERGFLDHAIAVNEGYERLGSLMEGVTIELGDLTRAVEAASVDIDKINSNPSSSSPSAARSACRRLAERFSRYNDNLEIANEEYSMISAETVDSLESMMAFQINNSESSNTEIGDQFESLLELKDSLIFGRNSVMNFSDVIENLPRMERRLNRELTRGVTETRRIANNLGNTIASIERAISKTA